MKKSMLISGLLLASLSPSLADEVKSSDLISGTKIYVYNNGLIWENGTLQPNTSNKGLNDHYVWSYWGETDNVQSQGSEPNNTVGWLPQNGANYAFYGYEAAAANGVLTLTATGIATEINYSGANSPQGTIIYFSDSITKVTTATWQGGTGTYHLGESTLFTSGNCGVDNNARLTYNFSSLAGNAKLSYTQGFYFRGGSTMTFTGAHTFDTETYTRLLMETNNLANYSEGMVVGDFNLTDANGSTLTNAGIVENLDALQAGQYGLLVDGKNVTLVAKQSAFSPAIPEPTTATLSLLALAGLAARRRRKD